MTGRELVRYPEGKGWRLEHIRGSHHILRSGGRLVSIPVHAGRTLGRGLLLRILRQAGLR